jgi:hypothetical protein
VNLSVTVDTNIEQDMARGFVCGISDTITKRPMHSVAIGKRLLE